MTNLEQCQQSLHKQVLQNSNLKGNLSKLMKEAWGDDKISCIKAFGSINTIAEYSKNIKSTKNTKDIPSTANQTQTHINTQRQNTTKTTTIQHNAAPKEDSFITQAKYI